jgi:hypothetical protein
MCQNAQEALTTLDCFGPPEPVKELVCLYAQRLRSLICPAIQLICIWLKNKMLIIDDQISIFSSAKQQSKQR